MKRIELCVVVAALLGLCQTASAAVQWRPLGTFPGTALAAGGGRVVAASGRHELALLGPSGVQRRFDLGQCSFVGPAGARQAALFCGAGNHSLLDLSSGAIAPVRLTPEVAKALESELGTSITAVGRRWLTFTLSGDHYTIERYWSRTTGRLFDGGAGARDAIDLDAQTPVVPLCRPVKRPGNPDRSDAALPFLPIQRTGRWTVFARMGATRVTGLYAWRCGHRKPVRISACPHRSCLQFAVRSNLVAWTSDRGVRTMDLATGRRLLGGPRSDVRVALGSGDRVYASSRDGTAEQLAISVARAR
jgi:hypothetical protein